MNLQITCKGIQYPDSIEQHARKKLAKVVAFLEHDRSPVEIRLVLTGHPNHAHHEVHLHITAPGYRCDVHREGPRLEQIVDAAADRAYEMLHGEKERHVHDRDHQGKERKTRAQEDN